MNLAEIYNTEKKSEEKKKPSSESSVKKIVDKFSIFASISANIKLIRQDIAKLVKAQGVKPTTKTESFFLSQKEKENVYESKIQKIKSTSPTKVETKPTKTESTGPFDFLKSILSLFIKGGVLTAFIGGIGSLLQDPEIRKNLTEFFVGAVEFVLKGVREITSFMGDILKDDRVIRSIIDTVSLIFNTMKDVVAKIFNTEVETKYGKFSVGVILGSLVGVLVAFKEAIGLASAALIGLAARPPGSPGSAPPPAGRTAAGAGAAGVMGRVVKFVRNVGPVALLGGVLYYINEKTGEATPAPEGTPIPPGTPEVSANEVQTIPGAEPTSQTTPSNMTVPPVVTPQAPPSDTTKAVVNTTVAAGGAFTAYQASKAVKEIPGLAAKTGEKILDARTQSVGQLAKSAPDTKWGRFLSYVAKKSPNLAGKVAVKLAQSATLMALPVAGWIAAAANLGVSAFTAYQLYELWKEFSDIDTGEPKEVSTSPEPVLSPEETNISPEPVMTPTPVATSVPRSVTSDMRQGRGFNRAEQRAGSYTSPTPASSQTGSNTNIKLNDEQKKMATLIFDRFKQAGFTDDQANAAIVNAYAESRLRPEAKSPITPKEESYGLFQMNTKGGLGQGHDPQKLMDPNYNITLAIDAAKKSKLFVASKNLDEAIRAFTIEVERPANMLTEAEKRVNTASSILGTTPTTVAATPTMPTAMDAAPTGGQKVMTASADFSDFIRQVLQPTVNVNAPTTNVQQAAAPRTQQNYTQPSVVDTEFMKLLVGRTVNL